MASSNGTRVNQLKNQQGRRRRRHDKSVVNDNDDEVDGNNDDDHLDVVAVTELITRILLEHFGDGRPVHADVVMDTVQYRLAQEQMAVVRRVRSDADDRRDYYYYNDDDRWRQDEYYCVWADRRVSRVYRRCLLRLVRAGRVRVVYDCGDHGCCGGCRENDDDPADRRRCGNGRDDGSCDRKPTAAAAAKKFRTITRPATRAKQQPPPIPPVGHSVS